MSLYLQGIPDLPILIQTLLEELSNILFLGGEELAELGAGGKGWGQESGYGQEEAYV